jgi:hypothetical protein
MENFLLISITQLPFGIWFRRSGTAELPINQSGITDFCAGANSRPTVEAFSFHFGHLDAWLVSLRPYRDFIRTKYRLKKFAPRHGYLLPDDNDSWTIHSRMKLRSPTRTRILTSRT